MLGASKGRVLALMSGAVVLVAVLATVSWYTEYKEREVLASIERHITELREVFIVRTTATARHTASDEVEQLVKDCVFRDEYESMLGALDTVPKDELERAVLLSDVCGDYDALKKRVAVMELRATLESLSTYVNIYRDYSRMTRFDEVLRAWEGMVVAENARAVLLTEQAVLQGDIIRALKESNQHALEAALERAGQVARDLEARAGEVEKLRKEEEYAWSTWVDTE